MFQHRHRITLREIAGAAHCHYSTVSLALRNDPRLPLDTRRHVQHIARDLGYVPDPLLAALSSYAHGERPASFRSTLAWVTNFPTRHGWRAAPVFRGFHAGAEERACALGYNLETFWLGERNMTGGRASRILRARNIAGLIFAPQPRFGVVLTLDWEQFAAAAIGYSLVSPNLHRISPNQYRSIRLAYDTLTQRGYSRIGLVMLGASDDRVEHAWLAGYLASIHGSGGARHLAPLMLDAWNDRLFGGWFRHCRPDAILTKNPETLEALRRLGRRVPADVAVALLTLPERDGRMAGIDENPREVGAAAVDYVAGMIHRNERGVPRTPQCVLIDGAWVDGKTVGSGARPNRRLLPLQKTLMPGGRLRRASQPTSRTACQP